MVSASYNCGMCWLEHLSTHHVLFNKARWNVTLEDKSGTADAPIIVCGAQSAVIDGSAFWTVDTNTFGNVHGFQV